LSMRNDMTMTRQLKKKISLSCADSCHVYVLIMIHIYGHNNLAW
jgi:hypothetical protein